MATIKERIKALRKEKDLTQEQLSKMLGLNSKSNIANYENGTNAPSDEVKLRMCEIFDCSMDYLMGESDFKNIDETISNYQKEQYKRDVTNALARSTALFLKSGADITDIEKIREILLEDGTYEQKGDKLLELYKMFPANKDEFKKAILSVLDYTCELDNERKTYSSLMSLKNNLSFSKREISNSNFYMCPVYGKISAGIPNWAEECLEGYIPLDTNLMGIINPEECFFLRVDGESMNEVIQNGAYALIRKQSTAKTGDIVAAIVNGNNEATLKKFKRFNEQFVSFEPMSSDDSFEPINVDLKTTNVTILGVYIGKFEINKKS